MNGLRHPRAAPVVLCLIQFVDVLGVTSATTALPAILRDLEAPTSAAGPLSTSYAMFFGGLLVLGARLGDKLGHRRVLTVSLLGFMAASALGGIADELAWVIAARALQGAAAAGSVPSALKLLLNASPRKNQRRTALAAWSATGAAAGASGFVVGGLLVEVWDWPAVFWLNIPVGIGLLIGLMGAVPRDEAVEEQGKLDLLGAFLLIGTVMLLVAGASSFERGSDPAQAVLGVLGSSVLAAGLVWRIRTAKNPLVPRAAIHSRNLRDGTVLSFVNTATTSSSAVLATLYLQQELGRAALEAGFTLITFSILVVAGSGLAKPLLARRPPRRVATTGLAIIAASNAVLVLAGTTWVGIGTAMAIGGLGIGISSVAATSLGTSISDDLAGSASGVLNTGAQVGTAVGTALVVMISSLTSITWGWAVAAGLAVGTALWAATQPDHLNEGNP